MENQNIEIKSKKFINELNTRQPNAKVIGADRDLESLMAARDRRASKHGITIFEKFIDTFNAAPKVTSYKDDRFLATQETLYMGHTIEFRKNNKVIYEHESRVADVVADVIDLADSSKLPKEAYVCPNCGDISSTEELASTGCPYCGTHFSIPQLYPKVSHFAYTEASTDANKEIHKRTRKPVYITFIACYIPLFFVGFFFLALGIEEYTVWQGIVFMLISDIVSLLFAGIPALVVYAITGYAANINAGLSANRQRDRRRAADRSTAFSNQVFAKTMSIFGPVFNFKYFSSRVYNLLGAMIYAEDKRECPAYVGPDFVGRFDSIIDYVPIGMEIQTFDLDEKGKCTIGAKIIANTYSYVDKKILHRKAEFIVRASRNMNHPIDMNFSAHTYKCDGCSASFDVTKNESCPYCGRPNDMLDEEWYIDGEVRYVFR